MEIQDLTETLIKTNKETVESEVVSKYFNDNTKDYQQYVINERSMIFVNEFNRQSLYN